MQLICIPTVIICMSLSPHLYLFTPFVIILVCIFVFYLMCRMAYRINKLYGQGAFLNFYILKFGVFGVDGFRLKRAGCMCRVTCGCEAMAFYDLGVCQTIISINWISPLGRGLFFAVLPFLLTSRTLEQGAPWWLGEPCIIIYKSRRHGVFSRFVV